MTLVKISSISDVGINCCTCVRVCVRVFKAFSLIVIDFQHPSRAYFIDFI